MSLSNKNLCRIRPRTILTGITARQRDAKNKIRSFIRRSVFHICEANLTRLKAARSPLHYSLLLLTSKKSSLKGNGKWKVKSEEVISKKSSFLRMRIFWRREWDSNPRDVAVKRFSRKLGFVSPRLYLWFYGSTFEIFFQAIFIFTFDFLLIILQKTYFTIVFSRHYLDSIMRAC